MITFPHWYVQHRFIAATRLILKSSDIKHRIKKKKRKKIASNLKHLIYRALVMHLGKITTKDLAPNSLQVVCTTH